MENQKKRRGGRFISPFVDWGFKRIFGTEINKDLLIEFLNDLLDGERIIADVSYLNNELPADDYEGRGCMFDLLCREKDTGEKYLIEMQNSRVQNFEHRALFYTCRLFTLGKKRGEDWNVPIKGVYTICLLNYKMAGNSKLRTDIELYDIQDAKRFYNNFKITFIQFPYLDKIDYPGKNCTNFERWLYLLKHMEKMTEYPDIIESGKAALKRLLEVADVRNMTEEECYQYEAQLRRYDLTIGIYENCRDEGLKEGLKEGLEQGLEQGLKEGLEQGLKQGIEQGVEQGRRQAGMETASALKTKNISLDIIAECTGLSTEEIIKL